MSTAQITPTLLSWARQRARLAPDLLAQRLQVRTERVLKWEAGGEQPTFRQAQQLAHVLNVPFSYLFLAAPPEEPLPIPDLRTVGSRTPAEVSADLRDVLADALQKQAWYHNDLREQGAEPLPFVGKFTQDTPTTTIAADITATLRLSLSDRKTAGDPDGFLNLLVVRAEEAGVWVMRSGIAGNNTARRLDVHEFRGFAISDPIAPLVFINSRDARRAQTFTLVHELAHIWPGASGISDVELSAAPHALPATIERRCNAVAAEVLAPAALVREHWRPEQSLALNAQQLATLCRVSTVVVARRAAELGFVTWDEFRSYYQQQSAAWQEQTRKREGGPSSTTALCRCATANVSLKPCCAAPWSSGCCCATPARCSTSTRQSSPALPKKSACNDPSVFARCECLYRSQEPLLQL